MSGQVIPAEAIEAAARGLACHKWPTAIGVWESFGQGMQDDFRDQARAALKAAAPHMSRTITGPAQLEALPFGSAVQTSDESDTVVLRCEGRDFRNQSGAELSVETLWRYGTQPFTVIFEPETQP